MGSHAITALLLRLTLGALVTLLAAGHALAEEGPVSNEFQVKAAFLFNFLKFVEWPTTALPSADSPIVIGILGDDPFGNALPETIRDENVRGHRLILRRSHNLDDLRDCQLLFVSASEAARDSKILTKVANAPVLTVSDSDGFCQNGGAIQLYLENKKVHFMINPAAAQHGGLKVSSQLLSVAKVLGTSNGDKND